MPSKPTSSESTKSKRSSSRKRATEKKKSHASRKPLPADRFINRELSWLEFNERVLNQAVDASLPLLERAKFLAITSSNLDEFVMVRIGSLKMQYAQNAMQRDASGMTVSEQLEAVSSRCHAIVARQYDLYREVLEPMLRDASIDHIRLDGSDESYAEAAEYRFDNDVLPVLSPQAIFNERPFPLLQGLAIHVCVRLKPDPTADAVTKPTNRSIFESPIQNQGQAQGK